MLKYHTDDTESNDAEPLVTVLKKKRGEEELLVSR